MTFRKNQEMYEILNKFNVQDRWKPGTPAKTSTSPSLESAALNENSNTDKPEEAATQSSLAVASAIQNSLNPAEETSSEHQAEWVNQQDVIEDPSYTAESSPAEQTPASTVAEQTEPPYTFKFHPRPMPQEENAKPFGERKVPISYDMMILGGIVLAVILVGSFILGAKLGKNQKPARPNSENSEVDNTRITEPGNNQPDNTANQQESPLNANNTGNNEQNPPVANTNLPVVPNGTGNTPPAALEKYWSIAVCSVPVPGDAAKKAAVEKELEEFRVHLEQKGFTPAWVRQVGNYFELLVGKEAERIPSDSTMMQELQGMRFKTSQTKALYTAQPFVKSIRE